MKRQAFKMKIPLEHAGEYKRRHDEIWPELVQALREAGIRDYSIFLDEETGTLFAMMKLEDDNQAEALAAKPVMQKWWAANTDIQHYEGDRPYLRPLREVFHMD